MSRPTLSPDGRTRIEWGYTDGRMSHEIWAPRITDAETGAMVLDLWAGVYMWDAWVEWLENGVMRLAIREYLDGGLTILYVDVDRGNGTFRVDGGEPQPLDGIQKEVEVRFWRKAKKDPGQ